MTLNCEMAFILRYFTEFGSFRGALRKSGWQSHNYGQFTISMSSRKRLQRDRATPTVQIFYNCKVKILLQIHKFKAQCFHSYRLIR